MLFNKKLFVCNAICTKTNEIFIIFVNKIFKHWHTHTNKQVLFNKKKK